MDMSPVGFWRGTFFLVQKTHHFKASRLSGNVFVLFSGASLHHHASYSDSKSPDEERMRGNERSK